MIRAVVENLVGVVVGEAMAGQGGRHMSRDQQGYQQQQQQHEPQRPIASLVDSVTDVGNRLLRAAVKAVQYLLILEALLLSAAVLYGALYWLVMPLRLHDKPLYFDYSERASTGGATATVDFLAQHTQWDASPLTKVERLNTKLLKAGQHYEVGLELDMPTTYTNRRVGVFMIRTTLLDDEDNELATSARPAILPHTSGILKGVRMFFMWPLHLFGLKQEAETVLVSCINFYEENAEHPLTKARVDVSSGRVQFYRASVNVTPQLKGLPWLMHDWFYSTLGAGILFIASLEVMLIGFTYVFFFMGLEDPQSASINDSNGSASTSTRYNSRSRASIRAGASRYSDVTATMNRTSAGTVEGARDSTSTSSGGYTYPNERLTGREGDTGGGTGSGTGSIHADGLRRRQPSGLGGGISSPSTGGTGSPSLAQEIVTSSSLPSSDFKGQQHLAPPGVQEYQRGARLVRGGGDPGGVSIGGGESHSNRPAGSAPLERLSQEDLDAAAMASWAALAGNVDRETKTSGVARMHGDGEDPGTVITEMGRVRRRGEDIDVSEGRTLGEKEDGFGGSGHDRQGIAETEASVRERKEPRRHDV